MRKFPSGLLELAIICVLIVWIATSGRAIVTGDYEGLQITTPVTLIVVGALFAPGIFRRNGHA